jgi:hypothetical protein
MLQMVGGNALIGVGEPEQLGLTKQFAGEPEAGG